MQVRPLLDELIADKATDFIKRAAKSNKPFFTYVALSHVRSVMSSKCRNIKIWLRYCKGFDEPIVKPSMPMVFDLGSDPGERHNLFDDEMDNGWEGSIALPPVFEYEKSIEQYPNIKPGEEFTGYKKGT
jgi:hypothetical protein